MALTKSSFGQLPDGKTVTRYTLTGKGGLSVSVLDYGATLQSLLFAGKDLLLGYDCVEDYVRANGFYLGATVGRYANRIANGSFVLNGKTYTLAKNEGGYGHLHGGNCGFDKKIWGMDILETGDQPAIRAALFSPDGEEGYPGNLRVTVTFTVTADNTLKLTYDAISDADTVLNLTNHAYFNLNGFDGGDILDTVITLNADRYTPVDDRLIPTGIASVAGKPIDFRTPKAFNDISGSRIDHNYIINGTPGTLRQAVHAKSPKSGIAVTCSTDLPGVQIFTAGSLSMPFGKGGPMTAFQGFCMETQFYPDTPNHPDFPSCVLRADTPFHSVTTYRFTQEN